MNRQVIEADALENWFDFTWQVSVGIEWLSWSIGYVFYPVVARLCNLLLAVLNVDS